MQVKNSQKFQHDVYLIREPPELKKKRCFEYAVSRVGRQLVLNSYLIPNVP
jgi:hypothetical protein